ncbi:hypothetical protein CHUAL_002951 [Chamberlinius hualienensis]
MTSDGSIRFLESSGMTLFIFLMLLSFGLSGTTQPVTAGAILTSAKISNVSVSSLTSKSRAIAPSLFTSAITYSVGEFGICNQLRPQVFTLIYVHSAPSHFKHRSVIRRTFGNGSLYSSLKTVTVFFIGQSTDENVDITLKAEIERYHDIIQGDYIDSYKNLSLKAISALKWMKDNCLTAKYVLKVDDDMFVNVYNLVRHLQYLSKYEEQSKKGSGTKEPSGSNGIIHCLVWNKMNVLRNSNSKWYVTKLEYPDDIYPPYCSGSAFFMESNLVPLLYDAVTIAPYLWVDDVYATGLLAKTATIKHNSINSIVVFKAEEYNNKLIDGEAVFGHMTGDKGVDLRYNYWKKVLAKEEWAFV